MNQETEDFLIFNFLTQQLLCW